MRDSLSSLATRYRARHRLGQLAGAGRLLGYASIRWIELRKLRYALAGLGASTNGTLRLLDASEADRHADELRAAIRSAAGLSGHVGGTETIKELWAELAFIHRHSKTLRPYFKSIRGRRVLFAGQCYYNHWYLSRALRGVGWRADLLNWDSNPSSQIFYHGNDFQSSDGQSHSPGQDLRFYLDGLYRYDVIHFANAHGISFGSGLKEYFRARFGSDAEIYLLRALGKKICYTNNGCLDGVLQSSFAKWGPASACKICAWRDVADVCSDTRNRAWATFRNKVTDYQCLFGGNRADFNAAPTVHERPEVYCLDKSIWTPNLEIPERMKLARVPKGTVRLFHAVGNMEARTKSDGVNIKSTHVYLPLIEKLRGEGYLLDLVSPNNVPNKDVRFVQLQADIFLEMLTFGWFGANAREAMMLGKPVVCYLRPEWVECLRREMPECADELPIVQATPETVEDVLRDLLENPKKREEIGRRSREFSIKWHSKEVAALRFSTIYSELLKGDRMLDEHYA